jgi:hypothetical protein
LQRLAEARGSEGRGEERHHSVTLAGGRVVQESLEIGWSEAMER